METQLENLSQFFDRQDISVVVGFKKDLIMERFPDLTFIYNQYFDTTNTSKSLLKALRKFKNEDVLWLNGDVIFDANLLTTLQEEIQQSNSFISVNHARVAEEEVKYTLKDGFVDELSKEVKNGLGEAVGINFISSTDMPLLINQLENCNDNDYFEKGIELAIKNDGLKIKPVDISAYRCMEIDFQEDLQEAILIF